MEYAWRIKTLRVSASFTTAVTLTAAATGGGSTTSTGNVTSTTSDAWNITSGITDFLEQKDLLTLPAAQDPLIHASLDFGSKETTNGNWPTMDSSYAEYAQTSAVADAFSGRGPGDLVMVGPNEFWLMPGYFSVVVTSSAGGTGTKIDHFYTNYYTGAQVPVYAHGTFRKDRYTRYDPTPQRWTTSGTPVLGTFTTTGDLSTETDVYSLGGVYATIRFSDGSTASGELLIYRSESTITYASSNSSFTAGTASITSETGLNFTLTPVEWFSYGGVWNTTTGLSTGS